VERDSLYQVIRENFDDLEPDPGVGSGGQVPVVHAA
jgi:hypothetical protein